MKREEQSLGAGEGSVNASACGLWRDLAGLLGHLVRRGPPERGPGLLARAATETLGATRAAVFGRRPGKAGLHVEGSSGFESTEERAALLDYGRRLANWVERTRAPLVVADPGGDRRFDDPPPALCGARAFPLASGDDVLGALVVFDEAEDPCAALSLEARDAALLALAHLAALSVERDRLRSRAAESSRSAEDLERRLIGAEYRAAGGELAAEIGRELREPLTGIAGLASRVAESLDPGDSRRSLLERVVEEAGRLAHLVAAPEEFERASYEELEADTLNRIMSETLLLVREDLTAGRVTLTDRLGASLPFLLLDSDLMRRVFLNMLRAGIRSAAPGGRLKVEIKRRGDLVEIWVAADGERRPGLALDAVWSPFAADGRPGDLTFGAVRRLVQDHGVTFRATATREWPFSLTMVIPIRGNQDRRRGGRDRRRA